MGKITSKHIPLGLLGIYLIRSLITSQLSLNEVLVTAILAGLTVFYETKINNSKATKLQEQIDLINKKQSEQDRIIDDIKSSVVSVKVSQGVRGLR